MDTDLITEPTTRLGDLYTFGYGSFKGPADLHAFLEGAGVAGKIDVVIDVRFKPTGRNPLWRAGLVAETLAKAGIPHYMLVHDLGNPDFASGQPATRVVNRDAGMATLLTLLRNGKNVALMCVCKDTPHCHRRLPMGWAKEALPGLRVTELENGKAPIVHD